MEGLSVNGPPGVVVRMTPVKSLAAIAWLSENLVMLLVPDQQAV